MHVLIGYPRTIPVKLYGGSERVLWSLGKALVRKGHKLTFLVGAGSACDFADVRVVDFSKPLNPQIPDDVDLAHIFVAINEDLKKPHLFTEQGNRTTEEEFLPNTVFVSKNQANRYGSERYVHNGLDWKDYGAPSLGTGQEYFHFLAKASWRVKNVKGAIKVILKTPSEKLEVLGGSRLNFNMGFRLTLTTRARFNGMVGGELKNSLVRGSKGLLFPVKWHEPFGLALTESLFLGCPVFGTPYGSLSELISPDVGYLSNNSDELAHAVRHAEDYDRKRCHEYARDVFNADVMADAYLKLYEEVLSGKALNVTPPKLQEPQQQKFLDWD